MATLGVNDKTKINPTIPSCVTGAPNQAHAGLIPTPIQMAQSHLTIVGATDTRCNSDDAVQRTESFYFIHTLLACPQ